MKLLNYFLLTLFVVNTIFGQNSQKEIFEALKKKYSNIETVSADFSLANNPKINGKFFAKNGNKYVMNMNNRIITSNGEIIWNYSINQKQVVISTLDKMSDEASVEKILFKLMNDYKITDFKSELSSSKQKQLVLILETNNKENSNLNKVKLWLNPNNYTINSIGIDRTGDFEIWNLSNLKINTKIDDSKFEFKIPKNVEEIDLR